MFCTDNKASRILSFLQTLDFNFDGSLAVNNFKILPFGGLFFDTATRSFSPHPTATSTS